MTNQRTFFRDRMIEKAIEFKTQSLKIEDNGYWRRKKYAHILPRNLWKKNLWEIIRKEAVTYFEKHRIRWHSDSHNLLSSQVLCVNLFFPFKNNLFYLSQAFENHLPNFHSFIEGSMQFEYVDPENRLGEKQGAQTSVDLKLEWRDAEEERNLLLLEFKFTEKTFGRCSSAKNVRGCDKAYEIITDPSNCILTRKGIQYWDIVKHNMSPILCEKLSTEGSCPFRYDFYQLMRNQLLAYKLENDSNYDKVFFGVLVPEKNEKIQQMGRDRRNPVKEWKLKLREETRFVPMYVEEILGALSEELPVILRDWREYLLRKHEL